MKKILISALVFDEGKSGIAEYVVSVCNELSKENSLEIMIHPSDEKVFPVRNKNVKFRIIPEYLKKPLLSMLWHLYILPIIIQPVKYDFILLPAGNRRLISRYPANCVVTFHDLSQHYIPDKYDKLRMFYVKHIIPHYLRKAPIIMAISENTKNDLIRHCNLAPYRIEVNYNGFNQHRLQTNLKEEEFRVKYELNKPYIFYNSRIEHPLKNHLHLIRAFELLPDEIRESFDLVFCGIEWHGSEIVHKYVNESPAKRNIHFMGYVDSPDIGAFYRYAFLYVFPSFYEGFGIPLLEAMASMVPAICSNSSSLPEIGGDAILTFDPEIHADIASKIIMIVNSEKLRERMIRKGLERINLFSWRNHIERLLELTSDLNRQKNH
jgi:glycosyltransferase involved in cell wall biosynthesis